MKLRVISSILFVTMSLSLTSCGSKEIVDNVKDVVEVASAVYEQSEKLEEEKTSEASSTEKEVSNTIGVNNLSKAETASYEFIQYVQKEDYKSALDCLGMDTTFVTTDDLAWYLPRSNFSEIIGTDYELEDVQSIKDNLTNNSVFKIGNEQVEINSYLNDDNKWVIKLDDFVIEDWVVKAPLNTVISINDVVVDRSYIDSSDERNDTYIIPDICNREIPLVVTSSVYGDSKSLVTPTSEEYDCGFEFSTDFINDINAQVKDLLNQINADYEAAEVKEDLDTSVYVSSQADENLAEELKGYLDKEYNSHSMQPSNIHFTQVLVTDKEDLSPCLLYTDSLIGVNLRVEKAWDYAGGGNIDYVTRGYTWLVVEQTDDGLKLYKLATGGANPIVALNYLDKKW
jgi:hypothetical protein